MKGKFITIYGINNIGKSTHSKRLVDKLKEDGHEAVYLKYPIYDIEPTGPFLNEVLRGEGGQKISEDELQLWFVLNRYQFQPKLEVMLSEGKIVVAEDYVGTGIAWGMAKGLPHEWLESKNAFLLPEDFSILMEGERDKSATETQHIHEQNEKLVKVCERTHSELGDKYGWERVRVQEEIDHTADLMWGAVKRFLG